MNRILLIDDDIDDAGLFSAALKKVAPLVSLQYFNEADKALQYLLEEKEGLPDIVFVDINMPKINGWELLVSIRGVPHLNHVPVVIYSTSSVDNEIIKAKTLGANGYISKPDNFPQLKRMLAVVLTQPVEQLAETLENVKKNW